LLGRATFELQQKMAALQECPSQWLPIATNMTCDCSRPEPILLFFHLFFIPAILFFLSYFAQYFAHYLAIFLLIKVFSAVSPAFEHA